MEHWSWPSLSRLLRLLLLLLLVVVVVAEGS
jgi:hypothetical protein